MPWENDKHQLDPPSQDVCTHPREQIIWVSAVGEKEQNSGKGIKHFPRFITATSRRVIDDEQDKVTIDSMNTSAEWFWLCFAQVKRQSSRCRGTEWRPGIKVHAKVESTIPLRWTELASVYPV